MDTRWNNDTSSSSSINTQDCRENFPRVFLEKRLIVLLPACSFQNPLNLASFSVIRTPYPQDGDKNWILPEQTQLDSYKIVLLGKLKSPSIHKYEMDSRKVRKFDFHTCSARPAPRSSILEQDYHAIHSVNKLLKIKSINWLKTLEFLSKLQHKCFKAILCVAGRFGSW